ncbi:glomulin-like isoform X1 [Uranotaenia lowii]|uniref:glomulin-like isoform X1 n=1 Tax=Uranotaenia lowii TaxID=190385 RepID=UPI002479CEAC|nr:glomulin-like isoform X1 [Uranotaenia lowii]
MMMYSKYVPQSLKHFMCHGQYKEVTKALQDVKNEANLQAECMDIVSLLAGYLTEQNLEANFELYSMSEDLLKLVAERCNPQETLLEILEKIETTNHDEIFTSLLKSLQIVLLRLHNNKPRSFEFSLNSILTYIEKVNLPEYIKNSDEKQELLLETDSTVRRILQLYMTVLLFLEPFTKLLQNDATTVFRDTTATRKNILICFILQLLQKSSIYLNVEKKTDKMDVKTYTRQVAEDLILVILKLTGDPFFFLLFHNNEYVCSSVFEKSRQNLKQNIFRMQDKCSTESLAMFYYLLLVGDLVPETAPKLYTSHYLFETCLGFCVHFLSHEQSAINYKGIQMGQTLLEILGTKHLQAKDLDENMHRLFCQYLTQTIIYSSIERNRKEGTLLLRDYILKFDCEGRYLLISNLFKSVNHSGLRSYLATIFKNMVHKAIEDYGDKNRKNDLFLGKSLKHLLMTEICVLKNHIETDLIDNADEIISGLNILRFLIIRDKTNVTDICSYIDQLDQQFLKPLRKSIDMSRAHFSAELDQVQQGLPVEEKIDFDISVDVLNGESLSELTKERKLSMLKNALNTFDLMDCLLARVNECVTIGLKSHKKAK